MDRFWLLMEMFPYCIVGGRSWLLDAEKEQ